LVIDPESMPGCLEATAWSSDGAIMAVEHREQAVYGVQFHPESILTDFGYQILANFLRLSGLESCGVPASDLHLGD
jgi:anthranilate/para-aminobenzoate synthase component II